MISSLDGVNVLDTSVKGELPMGIFGLIIERSSNFNKGIEIIPGIVDSDTKETIKVLYKANKETIIIKKGQRIAQIILIPYYYTPNPNLMKKRTEQLGSSDVVAWTQGITSDRPFLTILVQGKAIKGLLDTGADKTCIAGKDWPSTWPVTKTVYLNRTGNGFQCGKKHRIYSLGI